MSKQLSRRQWMARAGITLGAGAAASGRLIGLPLAAAAEAFPHPAPPVAGANGEAARGAAGAEAAPAVNGSPDANEPPFRFCLNTGTIMGYKLALAEQVELAARAGYQGLEPWMRDIRSYVDGGGSLDELRKRIADAGLTVESAIGFPAWAVDDEQQRAQALEEFKRDMDLLRRLGGRRIAAPPAGINRTRGMDLFQVAARYRAVLELGRRLEVVPQLEIWGSAQTLGTVGEAALVAAEANHPDACLLLDVYHIYKGSGRFEGLRILSGAAMHVLHINDYPAQPPRAEITDAQRVYPGDGIAPLDFVLRTLYETGFRGALSLELFNRDYWQQADPLAVARTGLEKTRAAVARALGGP